jgi:hypothetical protein
MGCSADGAPGARRDTGSVPSHLTEKEDPTMYGVIIQEARCPRCGIRRTARLARSSRALCFNCRLIWGPGRAPVLPPGVAYPFTAAELARLRAYRGAIRAGLYHEGGDSPDA